MSLKGVITCDLTIVWGIMFRRYIRKIFEDATKQSVYPRAERTFQRDDKEAPRVRVRVTEGHACTGGGGDCQLGND